MGKVVTRDPEILGGEPVFAGTRVPIRSFFDHLEAGDSIADFLEGFPSVKREQVLALLEESKERAIAPRQMRILLDENVDWRLDRGLLGHEVESVPRLGWAGIQNGLLLKRAEESGFEVLITMDSNMTFEQNLAGRRLKIIVLQASSNRLADTLPLMAKVLQTLPDMGNGTVCVIRQGTANFLASVLRSDLEAGWSQVKWGDKIEKRTMRTIAQLNPCPSKEFIGLRNGGRKNNYIVEGVLFQSGRYGNGASDGWSENSGKDEQFEWL